MIVFLGYGKAFAETVNPLSVQACLEVDRGVWITWHAVKITERNRGICYWDKGQYLTSRNMIFSHCFIFS